MTEAEARAAVHEARLALRAGRALLRDLHVAIARAEDALDFLSETNNAQPKEAQRYDDQDPGKDSPGRGSELCAA